MKLSLLSFNFFYRTPVKELCSSINYLYTGPFSCKSVLPYPIPKLSELCTLSHTKLLENHTRHSGTNACSLSMGVRYRPGKGGVPCSIADLVPYVKQSKHCIKVNICGHNRAFRRKVGVFSYRVRARRRLVWFVLKSNCHRESTIHRVPYLILLT